MLCAERQRMLIAQLRISGSLNIAETAKKYNVSEETIRRDLNIITKLVPIKRVHGGAYIKETAEYDPPLVFRQSYLKEEKRRMAAECMKLINNYDSIMIDTSDTASYIAMQLPLMGYNLTVITNSMAILEYLVDAENITTFCIGGRLRNKARSFIGPDAVKMVSNYAADKCFISPSGVNLKFGPTDFNVNECQVRKAMLENSVRHYLVADHTKLVDNELKGANIVCSWQDVDCLISDTEPDEEWQEALKKHKVDIIR